MLENRSRSSAYVSDAELAKSLQRLWPQRAHESGTLRSMLCLLGFHHWLQADYSGIARRSNIRFCHWCSSVEIDGRRYG
jgi:hypothetical protein